MSREAVLSDAEWGRIEPLLPAQQPALGRPMRDHRQVVEGVIYRYRCAIAGRDLPATFGPSLTVWKRLGRFSGDGTWDGIHAALLTRADVAKKIDWTVSVDSTINRAHQHGTNLPREPRPSDPAAAGVDTAAAHVADLLACPLDSLTGGSVESRGSTLPSRLTRRPGAVRAW